MNRSIDIARVSMLCLRWPWALVVTCLVALGCGDGPTTNTAQPEFHTASDCGRLDAMLPESGLSLEAAREAHRRGAVRRYLRARDAESPGFLLRNSENIVTNERLNRQEVCRVELYELGRLLFEHEYSLADGLGQPGTERVFRRIQKGPEGGPETISCTSCHWKGGVGGSGAMIDNSQLFGDGDGTDSADERNPPALFGSGVAQALAREMNAELAAQRDALISRVRRSRVAETISLTAKGVYFGELALDADGILDTSNLQGIDSDLVIKPFGWKGTHPTIRAFITGALHSHLGIETDEIGEGQVKALASYVGALAMPILRPPEGIAADEPVGAGQPPPFDRVFVDEWSRGQDLFKEVGCATCHTPMLVLEQPYFEVASGDGSPPLRLDLRRFAEPSRLRFDSALGGYPVWMFSDFKRHDLGAEARARHEEAGVDRSTYLTRRLWGVGDSSPYFYDGHAVTFDAAIERHGGEAGFARESFRSLVQEEKAALRLFLTSLRMERRVVVP